MPLSKNKIKYIQSLKDKKNRTEHKTFVAEGAKLIIDLLSVCKCQFLAATPEFLKANTQIKAEEIVEASEDELKKATFLKTPPQAIAVFYQFDNILPDIQNELSLILDGIQNPGNLGTIVRIADWFGFEHIYCSSDTADIYNPKTVQATMGALARVRVYYLDLTDLLSNHKDLPVYGTFLNGYNIYQEKLATKGFIIMGNEGNGIRPELEKIVSHRISIPNYPTERETVESLNVAVSTAIICSEFRRRM